jgi:hypothetical protein
MPPSGKSKSKVDGMTHAQRVTAENDKFRAEQLKQELADYQRLERSDDLDQFRADSYKQALREAKAQRS